MLSKLLNWLFPVIDLPEKRQKTLKELDFLDDVWIKNPSGDILKGWVFDINKKHIYVTVPIGNQEYLDYRFTISRPFSRTEITQNNKTLYFNNPCTEEI